MVNWTCLNDAGILKGYITTSHRAISQRLHAYFGKERPTLRVRAPHSPAFTNGDSSSDSEDLEDAGMACTHFSLHVANRFGMSRFGDIIHFGRRRARVTGGFDQNVM